MSSDERLPESAVSSEATSGEPVEVEETAADGAPLEPEEPAASAEPTEEEVPAAEEETPEPEEAPPEAVEESAETADEAEAEEEDAEEEDAEEEEAEPTPEETRDWYVLKVQSNRENSIREAILRRLKIEGVEHHVSEIVVPTEKVSEIKDGKKRIVERKFFPGYIMVQLDLNDDVWFVIRETPGVGDFVGAGGRPVPMTDQDVARMLGRQEESEQAAPRLKINFQKGDRVKIKEGTFENFEGDVEEVNEQKGVVRVMIQIFNRPTPVELEYWQVEPV